MGEIPIELRLATLADIPALKQLIPLSVRELSKGFYTPAQVESALLYIFGVDSQLIADGTYFAAVVADQIIGCGGWSMRNTLYGGDQAKSSEDSLLDPSRDAARIRAFFVHPQWARRGIGKRIILKCEQAALEAGFRRMELGATLPGEPLYTALGYTVTDRFDIAMADGESLPAAHMVKALDEAGV